MVVPARESALPYLATATVAPIISSIRGVPSEAVCGQQAQRRHGHSRGWDGESRERSPDGRDLRGSRFPVGCDLQ